MSAAAGGGLMSRLCPPTTNREPRGSLYAPKQFLLRAMLRLNGLPWPDALLDEAARQAVAPRSLRSGIQQTKRELEAAGYIQGSRDELDAVLTWTLTEKGRHKARQLE